MSVDIPVGLVNLLRSARRVVVLTGAGISQESGLRTFRESQTGLWLQYRPEDLATPEAFLRNPKLVWDWYAMRRERVRQVEPNAGHYALARMENQIPHFSLITQNVDGLHHKAGNHQVIELHGNLQRVKCFAGCGVIEEWEQRGKEVPRCPSCRSYLRPDVVWFGETLPREALDAAAKAARACEVFFSVGTSGIVQPAASLAFAAMNRGAVVVEINLEPTSLTPKARFIFQGRSGEILPALVRETWGELDEGL